MLKKKAAINIHFALYKKIALTFFSLSIVFFFIIFFLSYRKAVIKVIPNYEIIKTEFIADIKSAPDGQNQLKGRLMQTELEEKFEFETKGEIEEPLGDITGTITIVNASSRPQPLVATTRFLTEDRFLFRLKKTVNVSANSEIDAEIYADNSLEINTPIKAGRLSIPGLNTERQKEIFGKLENQINIATEKIKIITAEDIARSEEKALSELFKKSLIEFANRIKSGEKVLAKGVSTEILNIEMDKKEGEKEENFKIKIKAKFTAVLFNEDELFETAKLNLANSLNKGKKIIAIDKQNLIYTIEKYNIETETANLRVMLAGKSTISEDNEIFQKDMITGLEENAALEYFKAFHEIKTVEIKSVPTWWSRLPKLESSIEIVVIAE